MSFIPFIVEAVGGGLGPAAHKVLAELAKNKAQASGESDDSAAMHIRQNLNFLLHRDNAIAILRRAANPAMADSALFAASVALSSAFTEQLLGSED